MSGQRWNVAPGFHANVIWNVTLEDILGFDIATVKSDNSQTEKQTRAKRLQVQVNSKNCFSPAEGEG